MTSAKCSAGRDRSGAASGGARDYDARVRAALALGLATLALGCGRTPPPAAVNVPPIAPPPASPEPAPSKPLPACAPKWLDLVPPEPESWWAHVNVDAADVARWEGLWIVGEPKSCALLVAIRLDGKETVIHANKCGGRGLRVPNASLTKDRLSFAGPWPGSTAGAEVSLTLEAPDRASGTLVTFGPSTNPGDERRDRVTLRRQCK